MITTIVDMIPVLLCVREFVGTGEIENTIKIPPTHQSLYEGW